MLLPSHVISNTTDQAAASALPPYLLPALLVDRAERCDSLDHCRTIWNIIWSCLATILACVWVAIHPNLPQLHPPRKTLAKKFWDAARGFVDKLGISLLALLAPEFILAWALRQWFNVRRLQKELEALHLTDSDLNPK